MNKTMHSLEKHQTRDTKRGKNLTFFYPKATEFDKPQDFKQFDN